MHAGCPDRILCNVYIMAIHSWRCSLCRQKYRNGETTRDCGLSKIFWQVFVWMWAMKWMSALKTVSCSLPRPKKIAANTGSGDLVARIPDGDFYTRPTVPSEFLQALAENTFCLDSLIVCLDCIPVPFLPFTALCLGYH